MMITIQEVIAARGGVLAAGEHSEQYGDPACQLCILEAESVRQMAAGLIHEMTEDPDELGWPDVRPINDGRWSSREVATLHLLRLHAAYVGWREWSDQRRRAVIDRVVVGTVRRIIAELPCLPAEIREKCRAVDTLEAASRAAAVAVAWAADADTAVRAARAAQAAGHAVGHAARTAKADMVADAAAHAARVADHAATVAHAATADVAAADAVLITAVDVWCEAAKEGA